VYRTLEGINESGVDSGQYLLEASSKNNPDRLFTSIVVGNVPEFDFNNSNTDRLYTTIQSESIGSLPNNAPIPDCRYLANFSNRLIAANCAKEPSFKFTCKKVFDVLTGSYSAYAQLTIAFDNPLAPGHEFRFYPCPIGPTTVSSATNSKFNELVEDTVKFQVGVVSSILVDKVIYDDKSHIFLLTRTLELPQNIVAIRFADKPRTSATEYEMDFEGQMFNFVENSFGGSSIRSSRERVKVGIASGSDRKVLIFAADNTQPNDTITIPFVNAVPAPLPDRGFFVVKTGLVNQTNQQTINIADAPCYIQRPVDGATTIKNGDFFVVHGLGTTLEVLESKDGRAYNLDREVVFQRANDGGEEKIQLRWFVISDNGLTLLPTFFLNKLLLNFQGGAQNPQFTILKLVTPLSNIVAERRYALDPLNRSPDKLNIIYGPQKTAILQLPLSTNMATFLIGNYVSVSGIGVVPVIRGVNYDGSFKIFDVNNITKQLKIEITPSTQVFACSLEAINEGTKDNLTGQLVNNTNVFKDTANNIMKIAINSLTTIGEYYAETFCFVYAGGGEKDNYSLLLSGYYKISSFDAYNTNPLTIVNFTTSVPVGYKIVSVNVYFDSKTLLNIDTISSLNETRVLLTTHSLDTVAGGVLGYNIPVPVPESTTKDVVSSMFAKTISDTTALAKIIKRFALAINSVCGDIGTAYWGSAVTSNSEPFPANGFKFVARSEYYLPQKFSVQSTYALTPRKTRISLRSVFDTQINTSDKFNFLLEGETKVFNNTNKYATDTTFYTREKNPNRVYWTDVANIELSNTTHSFKDNTFFKDLPSTDGEVITALKVFQNFLLLFKPNGVFRAQFNQNDLVIERLQTPIGTVAYKNIVDNENACYFVHASGLYMTDGYKVTPVTRVNNLFKENVQPNISLLRDSAGANDNVQKLIQIGLPFDPLGLTTKTDNQFVFNYNSNVQAWSRNNQLDARWWAKRRNKKYFASNDGLVFTMKTETESSKYSDNGLSIPFKLQTAFANATDNTLYKFFRELSLQYGGSDNAALSVKYATDYNSNSIVLETFTIPKSGFGFDAYGGSQYGGDNGIGQIRRTVIPNRAKQVSVTIENNVADQNVKVFGVFVAAELGSNTLTKQNKTGGIVK
jgi:hypothetical protein